MTVPSMCSSSSDPPRRELARRLFQKNLELEEARRKAAKLKVPSDQNVWIQMRDNFETIVLEDHDFSEQHGVEHSLWQLHHRKIDEHRAHLSAVSAASHGGKDPSRPDRAKKIYAAFKSFLSEATGFYHDLILKIRAKCALPLGYLSEGPENHIILAKDDKKSSEMRKGLISCHRCLIFLGDLARYKGMYGDGHSATRDYTAASSYYLQAASLWPSSGNPHHQLAILGIYTDNNELTVLYRYFRSLAVENPLLTARDNLIIAFEKNRQIYSQLPVNPKATLVKAVPAHITGRGRGYSRVLAENGNTEASPVKEREPRIQEIFKSFCTRFVRLNGILYTRTSLETFGEVFSSVANDLHELLSSGPDEVLNFGSDATENGMVVVKLIAILIFTVHNVKKESESQSHAEILQRSVLLQNALTAAFDFMGHIMKRCIELQDVITSYLLPAILVFVEWLACHPDVATGIDIEEKQAISRTIFWNQFVSLMNKLLLSGLVSFGGVEDEAFLIDTCKYDDGETENCVPLWEDFELRGFVPLAQAHLVLNFSSKQSLRSDWGNKEKKSRIHRILAAGRALMNVVQVGQRRIYFDSQSKKIIIGDDLHTSEDKTQGTCSDVSELNVMSPAESNSIENSVSVGGTQSNTQLCCDGEEDEVIVFKPAVVEKSPKGLTSAAYEVIQPVQEKCPNGLEAAGFEIIRSAQISCGDWGNSVRPLSVFLTNKPQAMFDAGSYLPSAPGNAIQQPLLGTSGASSYINSDAVNQPLQHDNPIDSKWLMDQEAFLSDGLKDVSVTENGFGSGQGTWGGLDVLQPSLSSLPFLLSGNSNTSNLFTTQVNGAKTIIPSKNDSLLSVGANFDGPATNSSSALLMDSSENPVCHPGRHFGLPPGFNSAPPKQMDALVSTSSFKDRSPMLDDYSWLDGYSSAKDVKTEDSLSHTADIYPHVNSGSSASFTGEMIFPFPGKQFHTIKAPVDTNRAWQDYPRVQYQKLSAGKQLQQGKRQSTPMLDEYKSLWPNRYVV
uniref:Protein SMG7 n=1 Tax=Anthurium amnicola TaxID=1678845 RepID=A0A1D1XVN1_9ARAE